MASKPFSLPSAMKSATESVTKTWAKQRKAEERDSNAVFNRRMRLVSARSITIRDAAFDVMEDESQ